MPLLAHALTKQTADMLVLFGQLAFQHQEHARMAHMMHSQLCIPYSVLHQHALSCPDQHV